MADASCSVTSFLHTHLSLINGTATIVPHRLRFTSHPRYSVASLLTSPLVSTTISKRHRKCDAVCLWRRSRQGSDPRVFGTLSVKENIYSNATRSEMKDPRAGSAAAAADAFARAVARAERPACKSISPVRHLPLWRSSPRHDLPRHRKVGVLRIFAKPAGERTCARHYIKQRVSLPSHFGSQCVHFIRARRFGGLRSRTLSPAPSPERNDRLANLYPPSDICPYGEAPLVTTCRDTAKSVSFGFLRSRQGSELARDIISSNAYLYLPILAATACTSSVRAGSAAAQPTLSPFPAARSVSDIPHKRAASSSSYPYGEVPLVFTRGASHPWLT